MDIAVHHINVSKTARYSTYGELSDKTKYLWFCMHGSLMTCEQVLYKFSDFDPETHFIISAEGLNRTYVKGLSGDAVATWMTSRDRLHEIADFSAYLTTLYEYYLEQVSSECKTILFGFSQGGTTMYRWLHRTQIEADLILGYSCWIPEDIDLTKSATELKTKSLLYTYGEQDQYVTEGRIKQLKSIIKLNQLDHMIVKPYTGTHRIEKQVLKDICEKYILE